MRAAPPIDCPLADGRVERRLIAALHAATGAVLGAWLLASVDAPIPPLGAAVGLLAAAVAAGLIGLRLARRTLPVTSQRLRWDGQRWALFSASAATASLRAASAPAVAQPLGELSVALDLGPWLLLRLRIDGGARRWAVLRRQVAAAQWHGLQLALRAHGGRWRAELQAPPGAGQGGPPAPWAPADGAGEQPGR